MNIDKNARKPQEINAIFFLSVVLTDESSRSLTIHPLTQLGKDIVLGFKFGSQPSGMGTLPTVRHRCGKA